MMLITFFLSLWVAVWNIIGGITIDGIPFTALFVSFSVLSVLLGLILSNFGNRS